MSKRLRARLVIEEPDDEYWENRIVNCLLSKKYGWGCLNAKKQLFTSRDLIYEQVPTHVVTSMKKRNIIVLGTEGMYKLVCKKKVRKKMLIK